jgi:ABC-2 type transport system ATP-binding protein
MIRVEELSKSYGDLRAVSEVSFGAESGEVFGLLGPNGAGKSTTISCLSGLLRPSGGRALVLGHDVVREAAAAKQRLGVVPQELAIYEELSAQDNLAFWGAAYGLRGAELARRIDESLERVQLGDRRKEPVKRFSGGMKRRLNFACGIVHQPEVLLLDEPTVGVDPQSRARLLDLVRELCGEGLCVLYTTHYMEEAEALCDRLAIMDHGRILAQGTLAELRAKTGERDLVTLRGRFEEDALRTSLERVEGFELRSLDKQAVVVACREASRRLGEILHLVEAAGGKVDETTMRQPSLETLFLEMTGRDIRGE